MDDPRLSRQLQALEEPVAADPAFLDGLFEQLVEEVGFRRAHARWEPGWVGPVRWVAALLVAALAIGGGLVVAAGGAGFIFRT